MYNLHFEPPLDPPEPEIAFYCDDCGGEIYVGETYYRIDGKNYCEYCTQKRVRKGCRRALLWRQARQSSC